MEDTKRPTKTQLANALAICHIPNRLSRDMKDTNTLAQNNRIVLKKIQALKDAKLKTMRDGYTTHLEMYIDQAQPGMIYNMTHCDNPLSPFQFPMFEPLVDGNIKHSDEHRISLSIMSDFHSTYSNKAILDQIIGDV
jgi:hypothetical protein